MQHAFLMLRGFFCISSKLNLTLSLPFFDLGVETGPFWLDLEQYVWIPVDIYNIFKIGVIDSRE